MARRLARIAALTTFVIPSLSAALGVGSLETESALNEPLEARIPLESADLEELETLRATLGSPDAFDRAGLERPFMLSRLEFRVVTEGVREPYVLIRTSEPVREPFLAFLVELNWAGGRLIREYTMLLDPPVHSPQQEAAPAVADGPTPEEPTRDADARATVSPGDPGDPDSIREIDTADEIRVQDNDTLWELADEARPDDGISVHQMMMALLEANPEAFIDGNVNNLRAGAILRVPERDAAGVLTAGEARQQFAAQVEAWQAGRTPEPAQPDPADEPAVAEEAPPEDDGRLEVVAAGETAGDDATASLMDDDLEASAETVERLQSELASMREEEASLRSENEELRQQTAELMQRVEALERTLDVQVEGALPGMTDEPVEEDIPLAEAPEEAVAPEDDVAGLPDEELPVLFDEDSALERDLAALDEAPAVAPAATAEEPVAEEDPAAAEVAVEEDDPAPVAADEPAVPQALWEDTRLLSMAGGGALLIALLVLLMIRRRRNAAQDASGMVAASAGAGVAAAEADGDAAAAQDLQQEADAAKSDGRDGVDPLEEIEVYLAYGRYDQAGDLLSSAIGKEPERADLRLKQLEVHALTHDRAAFEADAQELYGMVDGADDPVWQQVQEMGREIAPENPLFAAAAAPAASEPEPAAPAEPTEPAEPVAEIPEPAEEPAPAAEQPAPVTPVEESDDADEDDFGDLEFSLDDADDDSSPEQAAPAAKAEEDTAAAEEDDAFSLDFDLDDFQAPAEGGEAVAEPAGDDGETPADAEGDDASSLDFDSLERAGGSQPSSGDAAQANEAEAAEDDDDAPSFNLDDLDLGDDESGEADDGLRYQGSGAADDDGGAAESLTASDDDAAADVVPASDGEADDDDLFDVGDENSTKLDLARAYLDMGDSEGAKSLLDEVISEGSDEQKQEAHSLYEEA